MRVAIAIDPVDFFHRVANRWLAACVYYQPPYLELQTRLGDSWPVFLKRLIFPLPLLGLLVILWRAPVPMPAPIVAAIAIYALVLLPYVLVIYYDRYAAPLVGMKMLNDRRPAPTKATLSDYRMPTISQRTAYFGILNG